MKTICFYNPGHLDTRAFSLFGASAKPDSDSPIGKFGTGLKYAISVALRHNQRVFVELHYGSSCKTYSFFTKQSEFRGKTLNEIFYREDAGEERQLPYTLDLGKHWELWQAFRELESNCRDEGGQSFEGYDIPAEIRPAFEHTKILVSGNDFSTIYENRNEYFLPDSFFEDCETCGELQYRRQTSKKLFCRSVLVYTQEEKRTFLNTYNIVGEMALTEDRTIRSLFSARCMIARSILRSNDSEFIYNVITAANCYEEAFFDYTAEGAPSEAFVQAVHKALTTSPGTLNKSALNATGLDIMDPRYVKRLELTKLQQARLDKCLSFLRRMSYAVDDFPIICVEINSQILGLAKNNTIYLTKLAFEQSTQDLASTVLEEYFHLKHGYADYTVGFQTFLHNEIIRRGEIELGDPL